MKNVGIRIGLAAALSLGALLSVDHVEAQDPEAREPVVHLRGDAVRGRVHQPAPVILPPPRNVYQRATRRDRDSRTERRTPAPVRAPF